MKRTVIFILLIFLVAAVAEAQLKNPKAFRGRSFSSDKPWKYRRWELMTGVGTASLFGDIGGYTKGENGLGFKDMSFKNMRFNLSSGMRFWINDRFAARINLGFAALHTSDYKGSNIDRNFESSTMMFEPSLLGEVDIIKSKYESMSLFGKKTPNLLGSLLYTINVYGFAGFGGSMFSVRNGSLTAPGTLKDGGFAAVIPVGIGIRMQYNTRVSFGIEYSNRFAFSDYIDGYTSIYSHHNDMYRFFNLTWCYKLRTGDHGWPMFRGSGS